MVNKKTTLRVGQGFDIHKLVPGRKLILGGVYIPYNRGLEGHSDADCLIHAIIDSLAGAANLGDIGKLFPDNDPKYKDINSLILLKKLRNLLDKNGWKIMNIDSTVIIEKPKLCNFRDEMRNNIGEALNISIDNISIKFKTNERLGDVGRGKAVISLANTLIWENSN